MALEFLLVTQIKPASASGAVCWLHFRCIVAQQLVELPQKTFNETLETS